MSDTQEKGIIFTQDDNYAYRIRSKLKSVGINLEYVRGEQELFDYVLDNNRVVVLIDLKCIQFPKLIVEFANQQKTKIFSFLYLTEDDCEVRINGENVFSSNLNNIIPAFVMARQFLHKGRRLARNSIPDHFIDNYLIQVLNDMEILPKYGGYAFIKEGAKILINTQNWNSVSLKELYCELSKIFNKTDANIEKSIRLAISRANVNSVVMNKIFHNKKVSNLMLIKYLVEKINNLYYNSPEYLEKSVTFFD